MPRTTCKASVFIIDQTHEVCYKYYRMDKPKSTYRLTVIGRVLVVLSTLLGAANVGKADDLDTILKALNSAAKTVTEIDRFVQKHETDVQAYLRQLKAELKKCAYARNLDLSIKNMNDEELSNLIRILHTQNCVNKKVVTPNLILLQRLKRALKDKK